MAKNWSREEVILIVNDYFDMFIDEFSFNNYNKTEHRHKVQLLLNNRSEGSIEFKHQNISAVLREKQMPYIPGYKPRYNYQQLLREEVEKYLRMHEDIYEVSDQFIISDVKPQKPENILTLEVDIPDMISKVNEPAYGTKTYSSKRNYYKDELRNIKLGMLGEKFVLSFEKKYLNYHGLDSLIPKIEHVSQTVGDSAGFDILSFDENGKEKFIEVKTTQMGKEVPFYFTRNELGFSRENRQNYRLYRIFNFKKSPHFYQLKGALDDTCESISTEFMGWPK